MSAVSFNTEIADRDRKIAALEEQLVWARSERQTLIQTQLRTVKRKRDRADDMYRSDHGSGNDRCEYVMRRFEELAPALLQHSNPSAPTADVLRAVIVCAIGCNSGGGGGGSGSGLPIVSLISVIAEYAASFIPVVTTTKISVRIQALCLLVASHDSNLLRVPTNGTCIVVLIL